MDKNKYVQSMINSMKERTGKSLEEWVEIVRGTISEQKTGRVKWLKNEYGLNQNSAMLILHELDTDGKGGDIFTEDLTDSQFKGENAPLRPLFDWFADRVKALGEDIVSQPSKTYVPFSRKRQFLIVKPLKGKLHVGLALKEPIDSPRLVSAKGLGAPARITQQFEISSQEQIDDEAWGWIRKAYEEN